MTSVCSVTSQSQWVHRVKAWSGRQEAGEMEEERAGEEGRVGRKRRGQGGGKRVGRKK